jgi:Ion channel
MTLLSRSRAKSTLTGHRFLLLFLFLLAMLIVYPYAEATHFGYYALRVMAIFATFLSVYAAKIHRSLLVLAIALAIPAIVQRVVIPKADAGALPLLNIALSFLFDLVIIVILFHRIFANERPNAETIFGALCIYLLVGFSFASAYGMIATFQPNAFYLDPRTNLHTTPDHFDFVYYSFGTMTSLGAAGITPISGQARSITILEAILGVLYLAVLITRLMGAYHTNSTD